MYQLAAPFKGGHDLAPCRARVKQVNPGARMSAYNNGCKQRGSDDAALSCDERKPCLMMKGSRPAATSHVLYEADMQMKAPSPMNGTPIGGGSDNTALDVRCGRPSRLEALARCSKHVTVM